jgi:hypothetical protein
MTYVPPEIQPLDGAELPTVADLARPTPELVNRLAAMELRLRLMETAEQPADEPRSPDGSATERLGLLRPAGSTVASDPSDPFDERAVARSDWAAEALLVLTESLARQRGLVGAAQDELRETTATLLAQLAVERSRATRLEAALTHVYAQAQGVQGVVGSIQSSRSYRLGHRLARLTGRQGPAVSRYETPIAENIDPGDVALVLESGIFDAGWYLSTYPDVAEAGADPLAHFMTQARSEHRCPGPLFDTGWYVNAYGDQVPEGRNPLAYYLAVGWRQGHRPWETFDPEDYLRQYPELRGLDICPLVHRAATSADG